MNNINIQAGLCLPVLVVLEELERGVKKFSVKNVLLEWYFDQEFGVFFDNTSIVFLILEARASEQIKALFEALEVLFF